MKKFLCVLLSLLMIFSLSACSDFPKSEADLNESQVPKEYKTSHTKTKEAGVTQLSLYYDMNLIISVNYPTFGNGLDTLVIDEVNNMRGSFAEIVKEFKAKKFRNRGTLFVDYETYVKDELISVVFYLTTKNIEDESMNETVRTIVFDKAQGKEIKADNYFKNSYLSFVNGIASEEFAKVAKEQKDNEYTFSPLNEYKKYIVKQSGVEFFFSKDDVINGTKHHSFEIPHETLENHVLYGKIDPNKPMVAITFDDGPGAYTPRLLDVLEKYNARATFFLVGENLAESKSDTLKRMVSLGCELGSHSTKHDDLSEFSAENAARDVVAVINEIKDLTDGYESVVYRPPFGAYTKSMINALSAQAKSGINWSVDTLDWKNRDSSWVYEQATNVQDGDIILMHDIHKTTVDAAEDIVKKLIADGYQLLTVSELMEQRGVVVEDKPVLACYKD